MIGGGEEGRWYKKIDRVGGGGGVGWRWYRKIDRVGGGGGDRGEVVQED